MYTGKTPQLHLITFTQITSPVGKNTASRMQTYHRYSLASFRNKVSRVGHHISVICEITLDRMCNYLNNL